MSVMTPPSATCLLVGLLLAGTAEAAPAKLFPLASSGLPRPLRAAPGELTRELARSLGVEATTVPIEDAAALLECSLADRDCLEAIADSVGADKILFGHVERDGDGVIVALTTFERTRGETQRRFTLAGETPEALGDALHAVLAPVVPREPRIVDEPRAVPVEHRGVTPGTWGLVIGGGVALGAGLGFLVSANSLRAQVATAPTSTRGDLERLVALETAGKQRLQLGAGLTAIGGVVGAIGVIRMVVQKRRPEEPRVDVLPEAGGASVRFSMGWR